MSASWTNPFPLTADIFYRHPLTTLQLVKLVLIPWLLRYFHCLPYRVFLNKITVLLHLLENIFLLTPALTVTLNRNNVLEELTK